MSFITRILGSHLSICREGAEDITHDLTGTASVSASVNVVGAATLFTEELAVGDNITVGGVAKVVATITSNTALTVTVAFGGVLAGQALKLIEDASEAARPSDLASNWSKLGDVEDFAYKPKVDAEEVMAPAETGGYHRKAKITKQATLDFDFTLNDLSELIFELLLLASGAIAEGGSATPMSGDGMIRGWFRCQQRDEEGTLLNVLTVWGELSIGDLGMGNAVPKPKLTISVLRNTAGRAALTLNA